jgi:negative regulator of sigma E activity
VCMFLWAKSFSAKDIYKMFYVCGGKCLSRKAVHNWVEKFSEGRSKVRDDARPRAEVAETTVRRLLYCDGTSVSLLVEDMSRNKCLF